MTNFAPWEKAAGNPGGISRTFPTDPEDRTRQPFPLVSIAGRSASI
jgi:hypothetical protein